MQLLQPFIKSILFSLSLLCMALVTNAQYEQLLHKSFKEKHSLLVNLYYNQLNLYAGDSAEVAKKIARLREFGEKHDDASLVDEADYAAIMNLLWHDGGAFSEGAADMETFAEKCIKDGKLIFACRSYRVVGDYYWDKKRYEQAFDIYFKLMALQPRLSINEYIEKGVDYARLSNAYYYFKDYRQSIASMMPALKYPFPPNNQHGKAAAIGVIGLCYQKLGMLDSSDYYFRQILKDSGYSLYHQWYGITCGNLGYNAYLRKDYDAAIPLLQTDIDTAIRYEDFGLAVGSIIPMANIRLQQGNMRAAETLAAQARSYIEASGQTSRYENLYPLLSRIYLGKGNQQLAAAYLDSSLMIKDSLMERFSALQLARAQQRHQLNLASAEKVRLEAEKDSRTTQRNLLLVFAALLTLIAVYVYRLTRKRHQQDQLLKNIQLQQKEAELKSAAEQLKDFALHISEKTQLLEELEEQLQQRNAEEEQLLEKLRQSTLLTDDQWEKFRLLFENVHAGYLHRLREKLPNLTPAETRIMALAKLRFSNKEMAASLGVSPQTVRVTWHRLRKKLNLPEEENLDSLLESI